MTGYLSLFFTVSLERLFSFAHLSFCFFSAEFSPDVSDDALHSDASETSEMSEISRISTISIKSTQSEKPHRKFSEFTSKMESRAGGGSSRVSSSASSSTTGSTGAVTGAMTGAVTGANSKTPLNRSLSNSDVSGFEKTDGSISDSAVSSSVTEGRKRRPSLGYKVAALVGLSRKSNSTSQLTGIGKSKSHIEIYLLQGNLHSSLFVNNHNTHNNHNNHNTHSFFYSPKYEDGKKILICIFYIPISRFWWFIFYCKDKI